MENSHGDISLGQTERLSNQGAGRNTAPPVARSARSRAGRRPTPWLMPLSRSDVLSCHRRSAAARRRPEAAAPGRSRSSRSWTAPCRRRRSAQRCDQSRQERLAKSIASASRSMRSMRSPVSNPVNCLSRGGGTASPHRDADLHGGEHRSIVDAMSFNALQASLRLPPRATAQDSRHRPIGGSKRWTSPPGISASNENGDAASPQYRFGFLGTVAGCVWRAGSFSLDPELSSARRGDLVRGRRRRRVG